MTSPINTLAQLNFGSASAISENTNDELRNHLYVETQLDTKLLTEIQNDCFDLVLISGNAGDGKTAFLKQMEKQTGCKTKSGKDIVIDFDATESDSPDMTQAEKLTKLFQSFSDHRHEEGRSLDAVYVVAINTGMIMHFFNNTEDFKKLQAIVMNEIQIQSSVVETHIETPWRVLLVDLNNRALFHAYDAGGERDPSLYDRLLEKLFDPSSFIWADCQACVVKDKCFVRFNAESLLDEVGAERLKLLLNFVYLDSEFHITTRNLLNILSYLAISHHSYYTTPNFCDQIRQGIQKIERFEADLRRGEKRLISKEKGLLKYKELTVLSDYTQKLYYNLAMNDGELFTQTQLLNNESHSLGGQLIELLNGKGQCNDFVNRSNQKVDELSAEIFFNLEVILAGEKEWALSTFEKFLFGIYSRILEDIHKELSQWSNQITDEIEANVLTEVRHIQLELFRVLKRREFFVNRDLKVEDLSRYPFFHEYLQMIQQSTDLLNPLNGENEELYHDVHSQLHENVVQYLTKLIHKQQGLSNWEQDTGEFYLVKDKNADRSLYRAYERARFEPELMLSFPENQYRYMDCLLRFLTLQVNEQVRFTVNVGFYDFLRSISVGYEPLDNEVQSFSQVKILVEALKKTPSNESNQEELLLMDNTGEESFHVFYRSMMKKKTLMVEKKR